jgi:hypothetical protein
VLRVVGGTFWLEHGSARKPIPEPDEFRPIPIRPIQRWTDGDLSVSDELRESVKCELLRACGIPEWEPGP